MYVKRDAAENIAMVSRQANAECSEWVEPDDAELRAFLEGGRPAHERLLEASDRELVRVVEDLVEVLVDKGVIRFTDLPEAAQRKLRSRRDLRASAARLDLMAEEDEENL